MEKKLILTINPGSTSTKIALFDGMKPLEERVLRHSADELAAFKSIADQYSFRKELVVNGVEQWGYALSDLAIIVARGGLVKPIKSGVYGVNEALLSDLRRGVQGEHASNLGGIIAAEIAKECGVEAYIADPVVVDELSDVARIGGHRLFPRRSVFHALNQKAVARLYAEQQGREYEELNLIVAHMGGGVSVGAHQQGRVVDVNQALDGEGSFSAERGGTLAAGDLVKMCFSGEYTEREVREMVVGKGGIFSHLGTTDVKSVVDRALEGDDRCALIIDAFAYNVAKNIGSAAVALKGRVDAIILTGGVAYSDHICSLINERVSFLAPVVIFGGEDEMEALAANGFRLLQGSVKAEIYR